MAHGTTKNSNFGITRRTRTMRTSMTKTALCLTTAFKMLIKTYSSTAFDAARATAKDLASDRSRKTAKAKYQDHDAHLDVAKVDMARIVEAQTAARTTSRASPARAKARKAKVMEPDIHLATRRIRQSRQN